MILKIIKDDSGARRLAFLGGSLDGLRQKLESFNQLKTVGLTANNHIVSNEDITRISGGNVELSKYFNTMKDGFNGGKASVSGFVKSLVVAKAKTLALQAAAITLNAAISLGLSLAISALVSVVSKWVVTSSEAREAALEAADAAKTNISSLQSLQTEYLNIIDSTGTEIDKQKQLTEWKKKLIEQYGFEQEAIANVNLERQTGIDLLYQEQKAEIDKGIAGLGDTYDKAKEKLESNVTKTRNLEDMQRSNAVNRYLTEHGSDAGVKVIEQEIGDGWGRVATFTADNYIEAAETLEKEISRLQAKKQSNKGLDEAEEAVLKMYQSWYDDINANFDDYGYIYEKGNSLFAQKIALDAAKPSEVVDQETYQEYYNKAVAAAGSSAVLKQEVIDYITTLYPQYASAAEGTANSVEGVGTATSDAADGVTKLSTAMSALKTTSSALSSLQSAYNELAEDGSVSFSTLADIQENFSGIDAKFDIDLDDYIQELADGEVSTERFKEIFSELTEAKIFSEMTDEQIVDSGESVMAAMLRERGVANADAVAINFVAKAKLNLKIRGADASQSAIDLTNSLADEATAAGITRGELIKLVAQETIFNNSKLDVTQKISALKDYAAAMNIAISDPLSSFDEAGIPIPPDVQGARFNNAWNDFLAGAGSSIPINPTGTGDGGGGGSGSAEPTWLEKYNEQIELEVARLESARDKGLITEKEYWQSLEKIYTDGYDNFENSSEAASLDEKERLDTENALREKYHEAHVSAYENEVKELDHSRAMNVITEEQYFAQLSALYAQYYAGQDEYREEAMEAEEELYDKRVELVEKWADAAKEAIEAVGEATEGMVSAMTDFIEGAIDTHEENFNLEKSLLQHSLDMNYITEEEYYNSLEELYKGYFGSKYLYMEQYWENQEEIYKYEQQQLEDGAGAVEDIHAKVVEMIKQEKEDAIDAIDETRDKYLDLIEIRRKALRDLKDEEDYEKERSEKLASVTELERQLNALSYDTSAAGVRKYKEIYAQLKEAKDELSELENERSYDLMDRALDDEENAVNEGADAQIETLNDALQDNEALVKEAWERMSGMNATLYQQLIDYNKQHSTSIKDDITGSWDEATRALNEYGDAYQGLNTYNNIIGSIGDSGMTDGEYSEDAANIQGKIFGNWTETTGNFLLDLVKVGAGFLSSFAGIVGSLSGNPYVQIGTGLVSSFAGLASGGAGMLSNVLSLFGGFASGTNRVPKTSIYRTDELGDELKFIKRPEGNYRILTEGSKVIDAESTERLMRVINNPDLLTRTPVISLDKDVLGGLSNAMYTDQSKQLMNVSNVFNITSSEPKGVASEIEKLMPKIANYTINKMTNKSINSGFKPPVKGMA